MKDFAEATLQDMLNDFCDACISCMYSVEPVDEEKVRCAIVELYAQMNLPAPEVVFLESVWQIEKALAYLGPNRVNRINASGHLWRTLQSIQPAILAAESSELLSLCRSFFSGSVRIPASHSQRSGGLAGIADHLTSIALAPMTQSETDVLFVRLAEVMGARFKNEDGTSRYRRLSREIEAAWAEWDANPIDFVFSWNLIEQVALTRFAVEYLEVSLSESERNIVGPIFDLAEHGHAYHFFKELCLCSLRPDAVKTDELGRVHSIQTPAFSYRDGVNRFAWHGVRVPDYAVSDRIPWSRVQWEANAEVLQVLIERVGEKKFLHEMGAMVVDRSEFGILYWQFNSRFSRAFLAVTNSTPELDGTYKTYYLRVPPELATAKAAVAWTFGMEEDEYEPLVQT